MPKPSILILDDDEMWLARHERRLTQAGFRCFATQKAKEAIDLGKSESSIKFALVDEILFVPPVPIDETQRELQRWQGSGVIREITNLRRDLQFIVITSAPQLRSQGELPLFTRETSKLRRQTNVIDVMHKQDIDANPDHEYHWLINDILSQPIASTAEYQNLMPRVLFGLGFDPTIFAAMAEQIDRQRTSHLPLAPFLKKLTSPARFIQELITKSPTQTIFIEAPGSKNLDPNTSIKSGSQSSQIIQILACQAALEQPLLIREQDYKYDPRTVKQAIDADLDTQPIQDFAYEYDGDRQRLSSGVQIEHAPKESSRLKTAIHRLKQDLAKANVAAPNTLFRTEQGGYVPNFDLGIIIYAIKPKRTRQFKGTKKSL
jgi:hypothetical protein